MKTHTLTVRDRRLSWDDRTLVRGSVAADRVKVALDDEYKACDTVHAVMVSAAHPEPVRMVVEGSAYSIPSELTRETGSILTCLIGYVGEVQRVTSEQESQPLIVVKSGPIGGADPQDEQPDLWAQLIATVESAERIAQSVRDDADAGKFDGKDGKPGAPGTPGAPGDKGDPGAPGKDGISPSAKVEQTAGGATVSITDKDGTTTATIRNGAKGDPGDKGDPGKDGTSPTASVKQTDTGATITVTDAHGTTTAEIANGRDAIPAAAILTGKTSGGIVNVTDAYPTALLGLSVYGKSVQDGTPSPDAPKDITNLNKAELVITGRNLVEQSTTATNALNQYSSCLFVEADLMPSTNYVLSFNDVVGNGYYTNEFLFSNFHAFTTKSGRNVVKLSTKAEISKANAAQYTKQGWIILKNDKNQDKAPAFTDVQIELGDTATTYEPHKSKSTPIDLHGNELCSLPNGVKDEVIIDAEGNVSLIKRVAKIDASTVNLEYMQKQNNNKWLAFKQFPEITSGSETKGAISSKFIHKKSLKDGTQYGNFTCTIDGKLCFGIPESLYPKEGDWVSVTPEVNAWFDGLKEGLFIYASYKNPQTIPLGKVELPALPEATSNVWNDGNIQTDVGITYVRDANIVIGRLEDKLARVAYGNL